jgi:eukaryotic translation initiation factor 2C
MDKFARSQRGSPDRILDNMCENLLRKINFKMQGTNTKVELPFTTASSGVASAKSKKEDAWQFMGADVIHPVCRQDKPSIAAVVGSGDALCSTSAVRICKQWPRNGKCAIEAVVDLQQMVTELLEYYREANDRLPNKIVFYRDGKQEILCIEIYDFSFCGNRS